MRRQRLARGVAGAVTLASLALALPAAAAAQAALVRTEPTGGAVASGSPGELVLVYDRTVEPDFAAVSVTDAAGGNRISAPARRSTGSPDTVTVPLEELAEGWYLVYWRVVALDGQPSRGAFTFAVGPNPGPAPEFAVPSTDEGAATARLVAARWLALLGALAGIGLFAVLVLLPDLPAQERRSLAVAFAAASAAALLLAPLYVLFVTAGLALRSALDLGALVPMLADSTLGRGFLAFEVCFAAFALVGGVALRFRRRRLPAVFALSAAALALLMPGLYAPAGAVSVLLGWLFLAAGSVLLGVLAALLVLPADGRRRLSRTALAAAAVFGAAGIGAALADLPAGGSVLDSSYGRALVAELALLGLLLLGAALLLARARTGRVSAALGGVAVVLAAALLASALAATLARPAKAVAGGEGGAEVGPGPVVHTVEQDGYRVELRVDPNRAAVSNRFDLRITQDGEPVTGARVTAAFAMLDMEMGTQSYPLPETAPGVYGRDAPALVMLGRWELSFEVEPKAAQAFTVRVVDDTSG